MAVAIWGCAPTPHALLDARLRLGWRPVPSNLADGARILGVARCLEDGSCPQLVQHLHPPRP